MASLALPVISIAICGVGFFFGIWNDLFFTFENVALGLLVLQMHVTDRVKFTFVCAIRLVLRIVVNFFTSIFLVYFIRPSGPVDSSMRHCDSLLKSVCQLSRFGRTVDFCLSLHLIRHSAKPR